MKNRAFTLIEMILVVTIVVILASIGLIGYSKTKERALGKEAQANLKLIAAAEKIYHMEAEPNIWYPYSGSVTDITGINDGLRLQLPVTTNWDYKIAGSSGGSFTADAERKGSGGYLDCKYSISDTDADGEPNRSDCP